MVTIPETQRERERVGGEKKKSKVVQIKTQDQRNKERNQRMKKRGNYKEKLQMGVEKTRNKATERKKRIAGTDKTNEEKESRVLFLYLKSTNQREAVYFRFEKDDRTGSKKDVEEDQGGARMLEEAAFLGWITTKRRKK
jgi:hypothetical protein